MRLIFFGAGAFGLPTLEHLCAQHEVVAVVSQPDRPAGRKRVLMATPVAQWAQDHGLPILKTDNVNTEAFVAQITALEPEVSVVIAFGQKLSPPLIGAMGRLAVNLHSSLLPQYRGAAPINWAMIDNQAVTGVSVIGLAQRMDAGAIYAMAQSPIDPRETAGELHDRLAQLGPNCVMKVLADLAGDSLAPIEQDDTTATKAPKFTKADGTVSFDQPAEKVRARVHGLTPWPGCRVQWIRAADGAQQTLMLRRVADHSNVTTGKRPGTVMADRRIACASGTLELLEVQAPGGKAQPFAAFLQGHALAAGDRLEAVGQGE